MSKCRREAVIRFARFNKEADRSNWFRAKLILYFPWYDEDEDLLGGCETYEEHYSHVHSVVTANERKYSLTDVESLDYDDEQDPQHALDELAPNNEESQMHYRQEGTKDLKHLYARLV